MTELSSLLWFSPSLISRGSPFGKRAFINLRPLRNSESNPAPAGSWQLKEAGGGPAAGPAAAAADGCFFAHLPAHAAVYDVAPLTTTSAGG